MLYVIPKNISQFNLEGDSMLIEVFTNGKVIIDGLDAGKNYKAEDALYDYLTNPAGFLVSKKKSKKKI